MQMSECICGRIFEPTNGNNRQCPFCQNEATYRPAPIWEETILFQTLRDCGLSVGDHLRLMAEISETMGRRVSEIRAEEALLADGRRYRHRAALFPEVSDDHANSLSILP